MKKWKLEVKAHDEWRMEGLYSERFIPQLVAAACDQSKRGFIPYQTMRVVEVEDGESGSQR